MKKQEKQQSETWGRFFCFIRFAKRMKRENRPCASPLIKSYNTGNNGNTITLTKEYCIIYFKDLKNEKLTPTKEENNGQI
jgi:hypothetical protein